MKCDGGAGRSGGGRGIGNRRHNNCIMTHVILTWNDTFYIAPSTLLDAPTSCSCKRLGCRKCLINLISRSLVWYTAVLRYLLVVDLFRNHSESSLSLLMLSPVELWGFYVLLNIKKLSKTRRLGNDIELTNRKLGQFQIILKTWTRCHLKKNWRFLSPIHQVNNSAPGWLHLESYIILYHIASYYIKLIQIISTILHARHQGKPWYQGVPALASPQPPDHQHRGRMPLHLPPAVARSQVVWRQIGIW